MKPFTAPSWFTDHSVAMQLQNLHVRLGDTDVLQGISLQIAHGRWTSIVGPNGAGKSTLLKAMAGLLPCTGIVSLFGRPLPDWPARERAQQLAWLGQNEASNDDLTVWDVAMLGRLPHQRWLAEPCSADHAAVERALRSTGAWDWRRRSLGELSGGERQRVLLARALAVEAEVLLMDEPLANLDPPHQVDWLQLVQSLVLSGKTVVSVLHEVNMALHADELLLMSDGQLIHQGNCQDTASHRALEAVFDQRVSVHTFAGQRIVLPQLSH
jgi:iron complex transport system ATP-binding protein